MDTESAISPAQSARREVMRPESKPLTAEITIEPGKSIANVIYIPCFVHFGNTGLTVVPTYFDDAGPEDVQWEMHFTPEGAREKTAGKEEKVKDVYAYALTHLIRWWENPDNFDKLPQRPAYLFGSTNPTFHEYNLRLLGPEIWEQTGQNKHSGEIEIRFHLDRLASNKEIRSKLDERSGQCAQKQYEMEEPLPD